MIPKIKHSPKPSMTAINIEVNERLKKQYAHRQTCEVRLVGCHVAGSLTFAHRHKRNWYKKKYQTPKQLIERLTDPRQVVISCISCHMQIERDAELTERVFEVCRGKE